MKTSTDSDGDPDVGTGEPGTGDPLPCDGNDDCASDEVCTPQRACANAAGRSYDVQVTRVLIAANKPDGSNWDPLGDPPDPFWEVLVDDRLVHTSEVYRDRYGPPDGVRFGGLTLGLGQEFTVVLWDDDALQDDLIGQHRIQSLSAATLHAGERVSQLGSSELTVLFFPR